MAAGVRLLHPKIDDGACERHRERHERHRGRRGRRRERRPVVDRVGRGFRVVGDPTLQR